MVSDPALASCGWISRLGIVQTPYVILARPPSLRSARGFGVMLNSSCYHLVKKCLDVDRTKIGCSGASGRPVRVPERLTNTHIKMAKVQMNPVVERVRGKIGDLVFKKYQDGVVVGRRADRDGLVPSPSQAIRDDSNAVLEQGAAVPQPDGSWRISNAAEAVTYGRFRFAAKESLRKKIQDRLNGSSNHGRNGSAWVEAQIPSFQWIDL